MPLWQRLEIQALLLALNRLTIIRSSHSYPWQFNNVLIPAIDLFYVEDAGFLSGLVRNAHLASTWRSSRAVLAVKFNMDRY